MIRKVKLALRLTGSAFDDEVKGLIAAALADLRLTGIDFDTPSGATDNTEIEDVEADPLIVRAVILYCKAHFGYINDQKRFLDAYEYQKRHLALARKYHEME